MKPVAIFRHTLSEGPGTLVEFLSEHSIPWQLICIDEGATVPRAVDAYSGLAFMGGPMSVNDDLPWIPPVLELIRMGVAKNTPVLGHCLGGQLMAKALGGAVTQNPVKEIGWGVVNVDSNPAARAWFGKVTHFEAFHWHGETFSLPPGAMHILSSPYCANQAYALGPHLGMQCHVEMTHDMIDTWCAVGADEIAQSTDSPAVQPVPQIKAQVTDKLPQLNAVARRLYQHWIMNLMHD